MSWNHEEEEDSGRARIHIWSPGREGRRSEEEVLHYAPGQQGADSLYLTTLRSPAPMVFLERTVSLPRIFSPESQCGPAEREKRPGQVPAVSEGRFPPSLSAPPPRAGTDQEAGTLPLPGLKKVVQGLGQRRGVCSEFSPGIPFMCRKVEMRLACTATRFPPTPAEGQKCLDGVE